LFGHWRILFGTTRTRIWPDWLTILRTSVQHATGFVGLWRSGSAASWVGRSRARTLRFSSGMRNHGRGSFSFGSRLIISAIVATRRRLTSLSGVLGKLLKTKGSWQ
jgi:hypothetical protein